MPVIAVLTQVATPEKRAGDVAVYPFRVEKGFLEAMAGAGADHVDELFVGNMSGGQFVGQEHLGPLMADRSEAAFEVAVSGAMPDIDTRDDLARLRSD